MNTLIEAHVRAVRWLLTWGGLFDVVGCCVLGWWGKALLGGVAALAGLGLCALLRRILAWERGER